MTYYQYISQQLSVLDIEATTKMAKEAGSKYVDELAPEEVKAGKAVFTGEKISGVRHSRPFKVLSIANCTGTSVTADIRTSEGNKKVVSQETIDGNKSFTPETDWVVMPGQELALGATSSARVLVTVAEV